MTKTTKAAPESLGSFDEREAHRIASVLKLDTDINARISRVMVDSGPTDWYQVLVASRDAKTACIWYRGYRTGRVLKGIEDQPCNVTLWPEYAALFPSEVA